MSERAQVESFLLVVDPLPLRLRSLAATEVAVTAAALADLTAMLSSRAAIVGRLAYILAENDWELLVGAGFMLEARRRCRRVEVERMFAAHADLAALATVYLEADFAQESGQRQRELFWIEDESRLVAA